MIGTFNINNGLSKRLGNDFKRIVAHEFPKIDGLYIDWINDSTKKSESFLYQSAIIEKYIHRKIPIFIFDSDISITEKEYKYLNRFKNVSIFEPSILCRQNSHYLPVYVKPITMNKFNLLENSVRKIDLYFEGDMYGKTKYFEKYYKEYASLFPSKNVNYKSELPKEKINEYKEHNLVKEEVNADDVKCFIIIDSLKNYNIGYLNPNIFNFMRKGCIPLLPMEHKYFHAMFCGLVIYNIKDINYSIESYDSIREVIVDEIYKSIEKQYPEFTIEYTISTIEDFYK